MSVRYLAQELYRLTRKVEDLEKTLAGLEPETSTEERNRLEIELLKTRQEAARVRAVLDSKKEPPKI